MHPDTLQLMMLGVNVALGIVGWSIKRELRHIGESIREAKAAANAAHARLDNLLIGRKV